MTRLLIVACGLPCAAFIAMFLVAGIGAAGRKGAGRG